MTCSTIFYFVFCSIQSYCYFFIYTFFISIIMSIFFYIYYILLVAFLSFFFIVVVVESGSHYFLSTVLYPEEILLFLKYEPFLIYVIYIHCSFQCCSR